MFALDGAPGGFFEMAAFADNLSMLEGAIKQDAFSFIPTASSLGIPINNQSVQNVSNPANFIRTSPFYPNVFVPNNNEDHVDFFSSREFLYEKLKLPPVISGPTTLCPGFSGNFTLHNQPPNTTITWITGGLTISGPNNQQTVSVSNPIPTLPPLPPLPLNPLDPIDLDPVWPPVELTSVSWIKAELRDVLGNLIYTTPQYNLTVNKPTIASIVPPTPIPTGQPLYFTINHDGPTTWPFPTWSINPSNLGVTLFPISSSTLEIGFPVAGDYILTASVSNICGTTTKSKNFKVTGFTPPPGTCTVCLFPHLPPCKFCPLLSQIIHSIVYPNPVSGILSIEIDQQTAGRSIAYDIRLFDGHGNMLRQTTTRGGTVQFNVANLPVGIYYLHIHDGVSREPVIQQIVVER